MNNNAFNVNMSVTDGQMLLPSRCAFFAYLSSTQSNVTGDGTEYTIISDTESFDIGNNYNAATGIFTVPVTASYTFIGQCSYLADTSCTGANEAIFTLKYGPGAEDFVPGDMLPARRRNSYFYGNNNLITYMINTTLLLNAGSEIYLRILTGYNGSKIDSVYGSSSGLYTYFGGFIL